MRIIKKESQLNSNVARAIRRLEYIQNEISEAIEWLKSDADCKDATCEMASVLYKANDLATALADDAMKSNSDIATESVKSHDNKPNDADDEDSRFKKAWDSIGFHGGGGTYSAEEFLNKIKKAGELKW